MSSLLTHLNGRCYDSLYVYLIYVHLVFSLLSSIKVVANKLVRVSIQPFVAVSHTHPSQAGAENTTPEKNNGPKLLTERTLPRLEILTTNHKRTVQHSVQRSGLGSVTGLGSYVSRRWVPSVSPTSSPLLPPLNTRPDFVLDRFSCCHSRPLRPHHKRKITHVKELPRWRRSSAAFFSTALSLIFLLEQSVASFEATVG